MGLWLVAIAAPNASAEQARDPAAADALFRAGKEAMGKGDLATACARFEESQRLDPATGTLLNLADCEMKRGNVATARQHFIDASESLPPEDRRVTYAKEQIASLSPRVPTVRIVVNAPKDGRASVRVLRDGVELGAASLGVALPLDPGEHRVVVKAEGRKDSTYLFRVAEAETKLLEVAPGERAVGGDVAGAGAAREGWPREDEATGRGSGKRTLGYASLGLGGVGIVVGAISGVLAMQAASTVRERCDAQNLCDAEGIDAANRGKTMAVLSPVGFAAGAVFGGLGAWLVLSSNRPPAGAQGARETRVGVVRVGPSRAGAGLELSGSF